jgi:hypothetical protein
MAAYGTFRVTDKKCATCNYYQGARRFGMQANKPYYVYAAAGTTTCLANPSRKVTANSRCLSWQKWVSIPGERGRSLTLNSRKTKDKEQRNDRFKLPVP